MFTELVSNAVLVVLSTKITCLGIDEVEEGDPPHNNFSYSSFFHHL